MGFYAPGQIVRDAREHGVEVRPVDVNFSLWDCTLEPLHEYPSPPFRGEREGPAPQAREGEVGDARALAEGKLRPAPDALPPVIPAKAGTHGSAVPASAVMDPGFRRDDEQETQSGIMGPHCALRLGLRQIKGFAEADAERLVTGRGSGYVDAADLWH